MAGSRRSTPAVPGRLAEAAPPRGRRRSDALSSAGRRAAWIGGSGVAGLVLFLCYLRLSRTVPVNSDGAANALQAWDMLHGNVLLHGWRLSDVSFYTTELPQYMLVEAFRGLGPDVVHVAAAMSYTLLVLLAALLARGRAAGAEAMVRVLLAAAIMLAPQLGDASYTLLLSPDHLGTGVPLLLLWLLIDRAPARWYVPVLAGLLLAWVEVADQLAVLTGVLPLVVACAVVARRKLAASGARAGLARLAGGWYEASLAAAALASVPIAALAGRLIRQHGGYSLGALYASVAPARTLGAHARLAGHGLLELFGASWPGLGASPAWIFAAVHLLSLILLSWALAIALGRFLHWEELLIPAFAAGIVVNMAAYIASTSASDIRSTREIAAVLPFAAVLCGRLVGSRVLTAGRRVRPVLLAAGAAGLLCYGAGLGYEAAQPPVPGANQNLATFLTAHHLTTGLAGYWQADIIRLESRDQIQIAPVSGLSPSVVPYYWEAKATWFDPRLSDATFVITQAAAGADRLGPTANAAAGMFGRPARTYRVGRYTVLVWDHNLLTVLRRRG